MKLTVEMKLIVLFVGLTVITQWAGEPVYNALHGDVTLIDRIKATPYFQISE